MFLIAVIVVSFWPAFILGGPGPSPGKEAGTPVLAYGLTEGEPRQGVPERTGDGEPGSFSDPVLTKNSFQQHLEHLLKQPRRQLSLLESRLNRIEQGIRGIQERFAVSFPDLRGHWAEQAVITLRVRGIIQGCPDGRFHPEEPVTRGALAVMLARAKNLSPQPDKAKFLDLSSGHWAAGAIGAARAAGYLRGYPDGTFRPEKEVTRAEVAVLLNKAFAPQAGGRTGKDFRDLAGHWAAGDIEELARAGILGGYPDGTFRPDRTMSRAEVAGALARILPPE